MLLQIILRARQRLLWNAVAAEALRAAALAAALLIVLLLLGADLFQWKWWLAVPPAMLAVCIFFAIRRLPNPYRTARILDLRLRLFDTLSTALFCFAPESAERFNAETRRAHIRRALEIAQRIRVCDAVPFCMPRMIYTAAPLVLVACSLFVLRYLRQDQLDFRQPMPVVKYLLHLPHPLLFGFDSRERPAAPVAKRVDRPETSTPAHGPAEHRPVGGARTQSQASPDDSERGEQQQTRSNQPAQQQDASTNLLAKLSDALREMLSRWNLQNSRGDPAARNTEAGKQSAGRVPSSPQIESTSRPSGRPASGGTAEAESPQRSQDGQPSALTASKGSEREDQQQGNSAGSRDGRKELNLAAQIAAMGKISVILGKRSETVTGETSLETVSGKQSLVTPYLHVRDMHGASHAVIDRDEVPVSLQDYVQRYFTSIRSHPPKTGTAGR